MENSGKKIVSMMLFFLIRMTKAVFMMFPGTCRFYPSCSQYAGEALATLPFHRALFCIAKRVLKCNPFVRAGYDPVPIATERQRCCE